MVSRANGRIGAFFWTHAAYARSASAGSSARRAGSTVTWPSKRRTPVAEVDLDRTPAPPRGRRAEEQRLARARDDARVSEVVLHEALGGGRALLLGRRRESGAPVALRVVELERDRLLLVEREAIALPARVRVEAVADAPEELLGARDLLRLARRRGRRRARARPTCPSRRRRACDSARAPPSERRRDRAGHRRRPSPRARASRASRRSARDAPPPPLRGARRSAPSSPSLKRPAYARSSSSVRIDASPARRRRSSSDVAVARSVCASSSASLMSTT